MQSVLVLFTLISIVLSQNVEITTKSGPVFGSNELTTRLNKTIYSFRGIPYAEPPINELRFKAPVVRKPWKEAYNATYDRPMCPQGSDNESEDCLYLNIYTTKLPIDNQNPRRPVLVYIHPGGFYSVTGRSDLNGPQYLLDRDLVLVTFNYRLGTLGFLALGTKEAPGNNGLKDQVLALKWVQANVENFGGNPNDVTIYGYSAGAWSVSMHLVSPMSQNLFHKAIIGSDSGLGQLPLRTEQVELAKKQAEVIACKNTTIDGVFECLKEASARELGASLPAFQDFALDPVILWSTVIEPDFGQERFLVESPFKAIKEGRFMQVPVMAGVTKDEFGSRAFYPLTNETLLNKLNGNFEHYAPICFLYERNTAKSKEISHALKTFYLSGTNVTNSSFDGLAALYSDSLTGFAVNRAVKLISKYSKAPVWYYQFAYKGRWGHYQIPGTNQSYGVSHHDDLIYLFYISIAFPFFDETYPEVKMVQKLTDLYYHFVLNGIGTVQGTDWQPYNNQTQEYLEIGEEMVIKNRMFEERYKLWDILFPLDSYL